MVEPNQVGAVDDLGFFHRPRGSSAGRGHHWLWRKVLSHSLDEGWSLSGFLCGLMLASLYGVIALILQNQPLWFCVHSTLVVALPTAFSMGLFAGVRADVMVMLPSMFSGPRPRPHRCSVPVTQVLQPITASPVLLLQPVEDISCSSSSLWFFSLVQSRTRWRTQNGPRPVCCVVQSRRPIRRKSFCGAQAHRFYVRPAHLCCQSRTC